MSQYHALIIDDNRPNLNVITRLLAREKVEATGITNPLDLKALLPTLGKIDVVFVDLEMPGMDGYAVKNLLRPHLEGVPIIACTVHVSEINVVRDQGFDGFLGKPLDNERFSAQLARILKREPVWERA